MAVETARQPDEQTIDLKDPGMAALLAWLIPGLGHWYQGRRAKAGVFFVCIMGLFVYGLYLSSSNQPRFQGDTAGKVGYGRGVYFSWRPGDVRLYYLAQIGVGLPALPALVQAQRMSTDRRVFFGGFMAPPWTSDAAREAAGREDPNFDQPSVGELYHQLHRFFELGTVFTMFAGLLNLLAIYDAWAGPVVLTEPAEKVDEKENATAAV